MKRKLLFAAAVLCVAGCCFSKKPQPTAQNYSPQPQPMAQNYNPQPQPIYQERQTDFVGPQGAEGPAGPAGVRGPDGRVGETGYVMTGPRGPDGPSGSTGERGLTGATGRSGALATGRAGAIGPAGHAGMEGKTGPAGARGASTAGVAGPMGPAGPEGVKGPTGPTGVRGPTLVGPSGPAGRSGPDGAQGIAGQTGPQGSSTPGVAGPVGRSGDAGPRGPAGPVGDRGPAGVVDHWISYRDFVFDYDQAEIQASDAGMVSEIASYMRQNPSLRIGIDGTMDLRGADPRDQGLSDRRVNAVRDALRQAGVPADKIIIGAFGDPQLRRDRRVEVLISTGLANANPMYANEFTMARSWQKATDVRGKSVKNQAGECLGEIEDLVVDTHSGRIVYGVLSSGCQPGTGEKLFAIPWSSLQVSSDPTSLTLNIDKDRWQNATGFDKGQWPNFADEQYATATYNYYNQAAYWPSQKDDAGPKAIDYRDRWNQRTIVWQKTSDLSGKDVRNLQNENLGKMSDLAIDQVTGRVLYGILSFKGKLFAVPWNALNLTPDGKHLVLNVDKERLNDSVSFGKNNWPSIADERWGIETHAYYNVEPYWAKRQIRGTSDSSR